MTSASHIRALLLCACILPVANAADIKESKKAAQPLDATQVYQAIKQELEANLFELPPRVQGHYGIRMYRMTGDEKYANAALVDLFAVTESQAYYACNLDKPGFISTAAEEAIAALGKGPRATARKKALDDFPEFLFYTDVLLRFGSRIDEFGLLGPCHDKMIAALKATDLKRGLTSPDMIESWAAQLANYVYWAKQLGVGDYLKDYRDAFNRVYPDSRDKRLDKAQFRNKLYGMTHFVFAASGYYQSPVDATEFAWVLDYFEANIDRILKDGTNDIIAEVGVSFLLAGKGDSHVVSQTRRHIVNAFDKKHDIIPSPRGNPDLALGEHRNMLAMMLLRWPETLTPGPYLAELKATKKSLPKMVSPKPALSGEPAN
ncbi:DUF3541 domain-containing protein [Shewanella litorisediminis]|uniref:DUF3541 domain-containing protein n=1 Tax=Shewanella litorisediminis TaxID=1173586 RepID=A0ABX7FYL4_9GAMM|nr:DUF3541 domain-containing protein [Shewanella litorisediminis]MCL2919278.1 DUF3541 domain-containing protein [Shewanella litorisediminis]QRH00131.1 DUF3541 domain-containing protein [Shewanella litorisediminis]